MSINSKVHFNNLTELRGIAALVVVIGHIDQYGYLFGLSAIGLGNNGMGSDAVTFFFVLSGFLITYLLMKEKERTNDIHIVHFYMRRILRIWPVYFLSFTLSLLLIYFNIISAPDDFSLSIALYLFMLANVAYVLGIAIRSITPLWSVGVEEQFYAFWPWIVKKTSQLIPSLLGIILTYLISMSFS